MLEAAAVAVERLGAGAIPHYVISGAESASDVLEVAVLLREVGLVRPTETPPSTIDIVPLFETIDDLHRGPRGPRRRSSTTRCTPASSPGAAGARR